MKILIAEDNPVSRMALQSILVQWGYEVGAAYDGTTAWKAFKEDDAPSLAILDWVMPGLEGPEVCRKVRKLAKPVSPYIILLTAKGRKENIVAGLEAGADDYLTKPFDREELQARLHVGIRMIELQTKLAERARELAESLAQVKQLQGMLPICSYCKRVRDDKNYWQQVEAYISSRTDAKFTHGICPQCFESKVKPELKSLRQNEREEN